MLQRDITAMGAQPPRRTAAVDLDQHVSAQPPQRACGDVLTAARQLGDPLRGPLTRGSVARSTRASRALSVNDTAPFIARHPDP